MINELLSTYPLISDQVDKKELRIVLQELDKVLSLEAPGDVVEFGCYEGTSSLFMQRVLVQRQSTKSLHLYDSFAGLPEKTKPDQSPAGEQFKRGELHARKPNLIQHFRQAGLTLPTIHKAWFSDLSGDDIPTQIAFAFLDGDFYESIRDSLRLIEGKLSPGSTIVIDDYQSEALPGAARAVDEWLKNRRAKVRIEASLAIVSL